MNWAIEHPFWFLGLCGVLILNGYHAWITRKAISTPGATVLDFPTGAAHVR